MRKTILSVLLAAAGAIGLAGAPEAQARDRIYVDVDDIVFTYGRPYWRHNREPLYVVYERGYPRYYRYGPAYRPGYTRYYDGPRYRDRYYPPRHRHYDRRWDRRYYDRDVVIEYRDWD